MGGANRYPRGELSDEVTLVRAPKSRVVPVDRGSDTSGVIARPASMVVEKAKRGDHDAMTSFFQEHQQHLHRYFAGPRHWHWTMVPDLVQETIARAIKAFPTLRGSTDAQAQRWLFGIARNVHLQEVSRQVGIRLRQELASEIVKHMPAWSEAPWYMGDIIAALGELPLRQLEPLRLSLEGLTTAQIAAQLGVPEGTVATRIHRARKQLRTRFGTDVH